jgi:hypothetical protein
MAALSDYLESGLLHHVFLGQTYSLPTNISIGLTSSSSGIDIGYDAYTGTNIPEIPSGINGSGTGYARVSLGNPSSPPSEGAWFEFLGNGSGAIRNTRQIVFDTALLDWGWVSGVAILDNYNYGSGNVLMHAELSNPRIIYMGDTVKFDSETLLIKFK